MKKISLFERLRIPTYNNLDETSPGEIEITYEKCNGCSLCFQTCPSDAIAFEDKKPRLKSPGENECMFCGACMAICPEDAITLKSSYTFSCFYKTIDQGDVELPRL